MATKEELELLRRARLNASQLQYTAHQKLFEIGEGEDLPNPKLLDEHLAKEQQPREVDS